MTIDVMPDEATFSPAAPSLVEVEAFRFLHGAARDAALLGVDREVRRLEALRAAMITDTVTTLTLPRLTV